MKRVFGVVGDSLNGITDNIRTRADIEFIAVRHEEGEAFAAGAEAHLTGGLAVCAGSCGPGNTHLINGLFDCHRSRVPVRAIAAQIPSVEIGTGYFQETHPERLCRECSHFYELIATSGQAVRTIESAVAAALGQRGVAVVVLPGDVAYLETEAPDVRLPTHGRRSALRPLGANIKQAAELLNAGKKVTILAGIGCADAHDGPALVDAVVKRQELSMPPTIEPKQAQGFGLYGLKALMNGRGSELLELAATNLFR